MPAIPTLKPITWRLIPASTINLRDDINNYLPLQLRDPRGSGGHSSSHSSSSSSSHSSSSRNSARSSSHKSSSSSSRKGSGKDSSSTTVVIVNGGGGGPRYYGPHNNLLLPVWAIIVIVVVTVETILFCCALGWFTKQAKADRKHLYPSKPRPPLRYSRIWLNAFIVTSWLWIPIGVFNMVMEGFVDPRKGVTKQRKVFWPLVDGINTKVLLDTTSGASTPYKGAGVGAGAGQDPEMANVKRTNSAYTKLPSGEVKVEVEVEEVKKYDTGDVEISSSIEEHGEKKSMKEAEAPGNSTGGVGGGGGGAFAGYAFAAPVPAPAPVPVTKSAETTQGQGAAGSYFAMSSSQPQTQNQQEQQGAAASYFAMSQPQGQGLPSTNPWGRQ